MTNACQSIRDDLVAHLDRELAPGRAAEVAAHLATCAACAAEQRALGRTWKKLDLLTVPAAVDAAWLEGLAGKILADAESGSAAPLRVLQGGGGKGASDHAAPVVARPAAASASRRLAIAAAALLAAGLTWASLRPAPKMGDLAVKTDHPAPREPGPLPAPRPLPQKDPATAPDPLGPAPRDPPAVKDPQRLPSVTPSRKPPASPATSDDPFEGLTPDEVDLVSNLDVLEELAEFEDLQTLQALDVLDDLDPEELDEG